PPPRSPPPFPYTTLFRSRSRRATRPDPTTRSMPDVLPLTVILPTRNPHPERLRRTLAGLAAQTLAPTQWEVLVIDNASDRPWEPDRKSTRLNSSHVAISY